MAEVEEIHSRHSRRSVVEEDCYSRRELPGAKDGYSPAEDIRLGRMAEANAIEEDIRLARSLEKGKVAVNGTGQGSRSHHRAVEHRSPPGLDSRTLQLAECKDEDFD